MRKLFVALNKEGKKTHIDSLINQDIINNSYFCPYCKKEVIPKLSDIKENHFAHKDGNCGVELGYEEENKIKDLKLSGFVTKNSDVKNPFEKTMTSMSTVRCKICKDLLRINNATKIKENIYLCKKCIPRIKEISDELL